MPVILLFYGLIISMYYFDNKQHKLPHIHVRYGEMEGVFATADGALLDGNLLRNKMKLVDAWIEIHRENLLADWRLAIAGQMLFPIDPLK